MNPQPPKPVWLPDFLPSVTAILTTLLLSGVCDADEIAAVSFNRDIRPILSEKCFACHGPDAAHREAELRLDVEQVATEHAIKPGDAAGSELMKRITSTDPDLRMPPAESGKQLSPREIDSLRRWINRGAVYQSHWSLEPPVRPAVPATDDSNTELNEIDQFVRAKLNEQHLQPSPAADRRTLIRRVTLDLTGLPPTAEAVEAFLSDDSEHAFEKVVDRLLASDRYGEHLARFWLDAAHYADTNGYQYDLEREQWVWRDWVINAFNSNMPFDQFTVEQLAGDLLPDATEQQKLATAFLRNHPITIEGGVIDEEYRTEYVVDRVVTTSTVWLGLTMTCSRCHDHKYDPVSQREFYSFFAYFNNVPERGLNGFEPRLQVTSPLQIAAVNSGRQQLESRRKDFDQHKAAYASQFSEWEQQVTAEVSDQWKVVVPETYSSHGGADITEQGDRSLLVSGANPATDVYELILPVTETIYAIRLEALTDPSFTDGGTGRSPNANFVLSEFELATAGKQQVDQFTAKPLQSATADYSQSGYPISAAIDGQFGRAGWAVDGNTKHEDRIAVFTPAAPVDPAENARLRIQLHFTWGGQHQIGRFRISLASRPVAIIPPEVATAVAKTKAQRTAEDSALLDRYLVQRFGPEDLRKSAAQLESLIAALADLQNVPATMVMAEMPSPRSTRILFRGEYDKPRDEVQPATPAALPPMPDDAPKNRLGLAKWLVAPQHPLTARVTVNRFWQQLFAVGIVKTTEDFGSQGEFPSHPELLDWLAVDFIESGWDVKRLLKQIVMSATYRQTSVVTPAALSADPENRLLARGPRSRLDAETIRDSVLQVSGLLSHRTGGPSVFPYHPPGLWQEINNRPGYSRTYKQDSGDKLYRRSLYTFWKRTLAPPSMAAFDAPDREFCVVRRSRTNTPLQAFVLLHDPQFVEAARHLATRILAGPRLTTEERIQHAFLVCVARLPDQQEADVLKDILANRLTQYRTNPAAAETLLQVGDSPPNPELDPAELAAWTTVSRVILNLSEFVTKP